nr:PREDICTED: uncharacterized protein LOC105662928 [Megachile rotundata]
MYYKYRGHNSASSSFNFNDLGTMKWPPCIYRRVAENELEARSQGRWKAVKKASGDPNFSWRRHWPLTYFRLTIDTYTQSIFPLWILVNCASIPNSGPCIYRLHSPIT